MVKWKNASRNAFESKTVSLRFNSMMEGKVLRFKKKKKKKGEEAYNFIVNHVSGIY